MAQYEIEQKWELEPMHFVATLIHPHSKNFNNDTACQQTAVRFLHDILRERAPLPTLSPDVCVFTAPPATMSNPSATDSWSANVTVLSLCVDRSPPASAPADEAEHWVRSLYVLDEDDDILQF